MSLDERNFRSAYYEKVGFRNVEEKKSLEILLKDKHLDRAKLKQFCLRFSLPDGYRNLLWKLLLGIYYIVVRYRMCASFKILSYTGVVPVAVPLHAECHTFIMEQRRQEYRDLLHALQIMRKIDSNTPKCQVFYTIWLLHTGNLRYDINLKSECSFVLIVQSLMQLFDDDADIYWLAKCFYDNVKKFEADIPKLAEASWNLLKREDIQLYKHLHSVTSNNYLPIESWFDCVFAGLLNETALAKYE